MVPPNGVSGGAYRVRMDELIDGRRWHRQMDGVLRHCDPAIPTSVPTRFLTSDSEISCGILFSDQKHPPVSLYAALRKTAIGEAV